MDSKSLERRVSNGLRNEKAERLGAEAARAYFMYEAASIGQRYENLLRSFGKIIEVAGYSTQPGPRRITPHIILSNSFDNEHLGTGKLSAQVHVNPDNFTRVDTYFYFTVGADEYSVDDEHLTTASYALGGGTPFLEDKSGAWILHGDQTNTRTPALFLWHLQESLMPKIIEADNTQALLWDAMQDPRRNVGMARAAQDTYQQLHSGVLETV